VVSIKTDAARSAFAAEIRKNVGDARGPDHLVSRADQAALDPWIAKQADAMRAAKKGTRITADALVDRSMSEAMKTWDAHNTQGKSFLSRAEVKSIGVADPGLGILTARATETVRDASAGPLIPTVAIVSPATGVTLSRSGDAFTVSVDATIAINAEITLSIDGHNINLRRFPQGLRSIEMDAGVPATYAYKALSSSGNADGATTVVQITQDRPGWLTESQALDTARSEIRKYVETTRVHDPDWTSSFDNMTWDDAVGHGALNQIAAFGTGVDDQIDRYPDRYVFSGHGPLELYTEATIRKRDGKLLAVLVEID